MQHLHEISNHSLEDFNHNLSLSYGVLTALMCEAPRRPLTS